MPEAMPEACLEDGRGERGSARLRLSSLNCVAVGLETLA